jgi:hypothetical protein
MFIARSAVHFALTILRSPSGGEMNLCALSIDMPAIVSNALVCLLDARLRLSPSLKSLFPGSQMYPLFHMISTALLSYNCQFWRGYMSILFAYRNNTPLQSRRLALACFPPLFGRASLFARLPSIGLQSHEGNVVRVQIRSTFFILFQRLYCQLWQICKGL